MPVHDFRQSFNSGELSPLLDSRTQIEKYGTGLKQCINFVPSVSGPLIKRAGTVYVTDAMNTGAACRLIGFNFGDDEYAILELRQSNGRWHFSTSSRSSSFGTAWTGATDYRQVKFAQINNIIYAVHPDRAPMRFTRTAATTISEVSDFAWTYPPMLDENTADITMSASATTGTGVTLTASAGYFTSANVGSYFEIAHARGSTFAEVIMGDDATAARLALTLSAQPADGDTLTIDGRTLTFRTTGRDAVDEIDAGETADDTADSIVAAINTGAGGALPFERVRAEEIGGLKAVAYIGNTTGTNFTNGEKIVVGDVTWKFESGTINKPYEVLLGSTIQESLTYLKRCMNLEPWGDPGTDEYFRRDSTGQETLAHPDVEGVEVVASGGKYYLKVQARKQGAGANTIPVSDTATASAWYSDTALSSAASYLTGGTRVISVIAKLAGTDGNSIAVSESSSALAWAGGATALAGGALDSTGTSSAVLVVGKWEVRTTGRWAGTLYLEKERTIGGGTWDVVHSWKSQLDHNVSFEGKDIQRASYRLRFVGYGDDIDGVWPRAVFEPADAFVRGLVKVTAYTSATQVTVTVIHDLSSTAATAVWSEGAWSPRRGYPRAVCFHQNRLWFAGTEYEPFKLWASALGDFENFRFSTLDDGAMSYQIASTDIQAILWLVSGRGLVIGTTAGEWIAAEADGQQAITPTSPPVFRQVSGYGSADVQAVTVGEDVIFVERYGQRVRRIGYNESGSYATGNLTALAGHICQSGVSALAIQKRPDVTVWAWVETYNLFVCLTYDPEQNVFAWSRQTGTQIAFFSVACVNGPGGEEVWIAGAVNGSTAILRMDPTTQCRVQNDYSATTAIHLDCAVSRDLGGSSFTSVTVPACLVGVPLKVKYADGTIATATPASTTLTITSTTSVTVGIAIDSTAQTMRLDYAMRDGTAQGRPVKVTRATLRIKSSQGGRVSVGDSWESIPYSDSALTYTGERAVSLRGSHSNDGTVTVNHSEPWPMVLTGLVLRVDVGDDAGHHYVASDTDP